MQIGREGWVMVPQLAVGAHDLCPPLQKQRILAYHPVHHNASEKIQFPIPQKLNTAFTIHGVYQTKPNYNWTPQASLHTSSRFCTSTSIIWQQTSTRWWLSVWKALMSAANVIEISQKKYCRTAPWEIQLKLWLGRPYEIGGGRLRNRRRRVRRL